MDLFLFGRNHRYSTLCDLCQNLTSVFIRGAKASWFNESMKTQRHIETFSLLFCLTVAIICFCFPYPFITLFPWVGGSFMALGAIIYLIHGLHMHRRVDLVAAIILGILAVGFLVCHIFGGQIISLLFMLYFFACFVVLAIQSFLDFKGHSNDMLGEMIIGLGFLALAVGSLFGLKDPVVLIRMFGGYWLVQGMQLLVEQICFRSPYNVRYYAFRDWLCLPAYIVGLLPAVVYMIMMRTRLRLHPLEFDWCKNDQEADLSVFVHSGTYASKLYGHMTFSRNGIAYSYGDYDIAAEKFFHLIGPGTFFSVPSAIYSNNCSIVENSPQFEYGIVLSDEQKKKFDEMIQNILDQTTPWKCPLARLTPEQAKVSFPKMEHIYPNRLWYRTGCKFRQYHTGKWAWYSLLGNNCSNFDAAMLNTIGLDLPIAKGIVSPGEYFEYFEEALQDPASPVIYRKWHTAQAPETLFKTGV